MTLGDKILGKLREVVPGVDGTPERAVAFGSSLVRDPFWGWKANPLGDQARFRRDTSPSRVKGEVYALVGGNRCLGGETLVPCPLTGEERRIDSLRGEFWVWAHDGERLVPARATAWPRKGPETLYRVVLANGSEFRATAGHRVLARDGWKCVAELADGGGLVGIDQNNVVRVTEERSDYHYDLCVPGFENYLAGGVVHHNSGKSETGAFVFARHCRVTLGPIAKARGPTSPTVCWVISETFEMLGEIAWKQKLQRLFPPAIIDAITWRSKGDGWPEMVRLKNGVEVRFKSSDQGREKAQGTSLFGVWGDEQIPNDFLEEVQVRLIDHAAPMFLTFTPISPDPAMQRRYENATKGWNFYTTDIDDNRKSRGGHLPDEQVDVFLERLREENPDLYETRKRGAFASLRGAIFKTFRPSIHVIDDEAARESLNRKHMRHFVGVDFGQNNPTVFLCGAVDPEGRWVIYDEYHHGERTIERNIEGFREMSARWGNPQYESFYCDPGDTSLTSVGGDYKVEGRFKLAEAGFPVITAAKQWWASCEAIMRKLARPALTGTGGVIEFGQPSLVVARSCNNLIRQMQNYRYAPGTDTKDPKDAAPIKKDDHAVDALRYIVWSFERFGTVDKPTSPGGYERVYARPGW